MSFFDDVHCVAKIYAISDFRIVKEGTHDRRDVIDIREKTVMSMESLNFIQFIELFAGFLGFTTLLPGLVFYRKVKRFPAAVRFLIYFIIGNFYIINLVQVLELAFISYRSTLILFTFVPAGLAMVKIYRIPVIPYLLKVAGELRHYILRELGFRSFMRHRLQEIKVFLRFAGRQLWRLLKEVWMDLPFLAVFIFVIWKVCGPGILHSWGFGASDIPVHNYWINGLIDNKLYIAGIYPMGMHCMLYYLATLLNIPVYVTLRLFWLIQFSMIAVMLLVFLKGCCRTRFLPWLGAIGFVGLKYFVGISYSRYGSTLPQEYGMLYILPSIYFLVAFFKTRNAELEKGINRIRCTSSWLLLGFAMSFSLTLASHFYDTIVAGILCIGIAIGYAYWFLRKEYFCRIMLAGVLSILMAFLPMAAAFLTGKELQGSMYWAMNVIGLRDYTELIFRILCIGVVAVTVGGIVIIVRGTKAGKLSLHEDKPVPTYKVPVLTVLQIISVVLAVALLYVGWRYKGTILWGSEHNAFKLTDMNWVLYGTEAAVAVACIQRYLTGKMDGAASMAVITADIMLGLILVSGSLGWPMLMEPYRACIYFAYLIPAVAVMAVGGALNIFIPPNLTYLQRGTACVLTAALLVQAGKGEMLRGSFGGGHLEMNEAILCTTNILRDNQGENDKWTIVSANDELRMVEKYGRHTETIDFLTDMEYWNKTKEVTIPTDRVYFYIEKKPLNYASGYSGIIPEVSEEEARKPLPNNSGINAYNGPDRAVTMSRMYYWAQAFQQLYPNEMKVYYENEKFVCYYIEQNTYRLYNFAIYYGYN